MYQIQAKSKKSISLNKHISGLINQFKSLKNKIKYFKFDNNLIEYAIFAHDLGKVSPSFQLAVGNWNYSPKILFPDVPHSIFSLLWMNEDELKKKLESNNKDIDAKIILSAVAFHHWRDNFHNIILGHNNEFKRAIEIILNNKKYKENFLENLKKEFSSSEFDNFINIIGFNEELAQNIIKNGNLFEYIIPPYYNYYIPQRLIDLKNEDFKKKSIFTLGLLLRIDHFTSFVEEEDLNKNEEIEKDIPCNKIVENNFKKTLEEETKKKIIEEDIWQFKEIKGKKEKNIILVAPTGSGKTGFAYLWGAGNKIFFTLPLRCAVNSIFERSKKIFNQYNVGLLHSDADVYLYKESSSEENFRALDLAKHLSLPLLVSTGDQIFPSALKYPGYEKIYATLAYSRLVIDEVQAYDPRAVAIIIKLIEDIVKLGGKFLLMTATLPEFVKEEIKKRIGENEFELIDRYEGINKIKKHKIEIRNKDLENDDIISEIFKKAEEGKRVLVILNTIEKSQNVFCKIRKLKGQKNIYIKLLHSKFTFEDRNNGENEIVNDKFKNPKPDGEKEGKILVATQVVEVSLNIDADLLYTELAPLDSLVQRMGRVLRRVKAEPAEEYEFKDNKPNVIIFCDYKDEKNKITLESGKNYVYDLDLLCLSICLLFKEEEAIKNKNCEKIKEILSKIKSKELILSEIEKKELVEKLYKNLSKDSSYLKIFYDTLDILDAGYISERKQEALKIFREIYTVPAIPMTIKKKENSEEFENNEKKFMEEINKYLQKPTFDYASFKAEILSKFIVNIDIRKYIRDNKLSLKTASHLVYEINLRDDKKINRLKKWLSDIYIFYDEYSSEIGVKAKRLKEDNIIQ